MSKKKKQSQPQIRKSVILNFFQRNNGRPQSLSDLYNYFEIYDKQDKTYLRQLIDELSEEAQLFRVGRSKYALSIEDEELVTGKLDLVNPNFGFVRYHSDLPDIYVAREDLKGATHGDQVQVHITRNFRKKEKHPEGEIIEIIKRGRDNIVGQIKVYKNYALVTPDVKGFFEKVFIPKDKINGAETDDLVIVDLITFPEDGVQARGVVASVLGKAGDNDAEMNAIMAEFGLPVQFPKDVLEEAKKLNSTISDDEISRRRDFRQILTFTIDPEDAKDFDDALSFQKLGNGNFEVGIHIADVTHYVKPGSRLDEEAYRRATSVYLVDRTIPMLPERLSNDLCSLNPGADKLTFAAVFELTDKGKIINEWFGKTIINSDQHLSYEQAQQLIDDGGSEALNIIDGLAKELREQRMNSGAFNFESDEVKFHLDEEGKPLGVFQLLRLDTHKLIEEFMLLANKRVAQYVHHLTPPHTMVYRIHEPPNPEKLETFSKFVAKQGYTVKTQNENQISKSLNQLMAEISGLPIQNIIESLAIRTMSKAEYSIKDHGHFGLAFDHYTHFTAPIRRYPDFMVHRLLERYLKKGKSAAAEDYEEKCSHSSDMEKVAAEAERASIKYKQVEYMSYQPRNAEYEGVVSGVTDFGVFVEISGMGAEGLARFANLEDDFYEYDADNYRVVGKRTGKIIGFGDIVKVRVAGTDLDERSIDLELISIGTKKFGTKSAGRNKPKGRKK